MDHVSSSSRARDYFPPRAAIAGPDRVPQNVTSQEGRLRDPFRMGIRVTTLTRLSTPLTEPDRSAA